MLYSAEKPTLYNGVKHNNKQQTLHNYAEAFRFSTNELKIHCSVTQSGSINHGFDKNIHSSPNFTISHYICDTDNLQMLKSGLHFDLNLDLVLVVLELMGARTWHKRFTVALKLTAFTPISMRYH